MADFTAIKIARELPPAGHYTDRGTDVFEALCGARIVEIGAPDGGAEIEGGGLVIDFLPQGSVNPRRVVFGFNENGMWVEYDSGRGQLA